MLRVLPLLIGLVGCAATAPAPVREVRPVVPVESGKPAASPAVLAEGKLHVVKKGDTLLSIGREYGLNSQDIAAWNQLDNPNRIVPGQRLRLTPPSPTTAGTGRTAESVEVQPIVAGAGIVARPLDETAGAAQHTTAPAVVAVSPAPSLPPGASEILKRAPKGGKLPYSEENLALMKGQAFTPKPASAALPPVNEPALPAPPSASAPSASIAPASVAPAAAAISAASPERPVAPPLVTGIEWGWPATGRLLAGYSESAGAQGMNRGIDIAGAMGDPVLAAAPGKVIFVGVYPKHGNLVVVLHAEGYSSVYAHTQRILVKEGQVVKRGQRIADLGNSDADQPKLHFEVRQQGKPLDPLRILPAR